MCLGIPGRVVRMLEGYGGQLALVDVAGEHRKVNVGMLADQAVGPGDWVIIHMGFALERTDEQGAAAALAGLRLLGTGGRKNTRKGNTDEHTRRPTVRGTTGATRRTGLPRHRSGRALGRARRPAIGYLPG